MIGSVPGDIAKHGFLPVRIAASIRRILLKLSSFRLSDMLSDDMKYALYFYRNYLPQLYRRHIKKNTRNCLFCSRLVKSECHRYCFKCSAGTYIKCSPPLPGLLYASSVQMEEVDALPVPWYFKKTCSGFRRLPWNRYWRNIYSIFPSIAMNNYEALEGLESGLSSGSRPCHICASVDYDFYKRCRNLPDFDASVSCLKIRTELKKVYEYQAKARPESSKSAV